MTAPPSPVARGFRRSLGLAAPVAAAVVLWLALAPLLAAPALPQAPAGGPTEGPAALAAGAGASSSAAGASGSPVEPRAAPESSAAISPAATASGTTSRATASARPKPASSPGARPRASGGTPAPSPAASAGAASTGLPAAIRRVDRPSATPLMKASLDRQLDKLRAKLGIPGVSAAVLFADGSMWTGTSGLADVAARTPVTPDTPFAVGSISKTFTAALVVALAGEGRIGLDTSVRTYLPNLKIDGRITVRQLLDHTSGLNDFFLNPKIDPALLADPGRRWLPADSLAFMKKPYFAPGTGYHYSNTNYLVLGMLAEAVGGAPIADQLHARFLDPLGLTSTTYQGSEPPAAAPAHGYQFTGASVKLPAIDLTGGSSITPFTSVVTAAGGAGSIATTADDLVHWARALYGGDALAEDSLRSMLGDVARTSRYGPGAEYGLGVQSVVIEGRPSYGHSGRLLGARAVVRWLPTESMAIAVLTNQSRADPRSIASLLLRTAVVQPADCAACQGGWMQH